ncbi:MAG: hypothetical protein ACC657_05580 [Thiohalomonadales bacterium]
MAAKLGSIVLDLRTNTAKFDQGLNRSGKAVKKFSGSLKALIGIVGTLAGVTVLGRGIKKSLEFADAIGKAADTVGLGVESFQELQHAAELAGTAQSQFTSNMTAFVKRVGEAKAGMGPLVSGLKNINAELLDAIINTSSQEEALNLMADAIQKSTSETEKAALANAAFSRAGVGMTIFLKEGSEGLAKMAKRARDLGVVLSEETVRGAEQANDKVEELLKVLKFKTVSAIVENAKAIDAIVTAAIAAVQWIGQVVLALSNLSNPSIKKAIQGAIEETTGKIESSQRRLETANRKVLESEKFWHASSRKEGNIAKFNEELKILNRLNRILLIHKESLLDLSSVKPITTIIDKPPTDDAADPVFSIDKLAESSKNRLESLRVSLLNEEDIVRESYFNRQMIVDESLLTGVVNEDQANELIAQLQDEQQKRLTEITKRGAADRLRVMTGMLGAAASIFGSISSLMQKEGKKQSGAQKLLARASIITSTAQAVMNALATPPYPLGVALAAAAAAQGAVQLSKVGGGSGGSSSVNTPTSTNSVPTIQTPVTVGALAPNNATQIIFTGDMLGEDLSERLVNIIQDATNNRDIVVFDSDSRQAQEIRGVA